MERLRKDFEHQEKFRDEERLRLKEELKKYRELYTYISITIVLTKMCIIIPFDSNSFLE